MEWNLQESFLAAIGLFLLVSSASLWVTLITRRTLPIASPANDAEAHDSLANAQNPTPAPHLTDDQAETPLFESPVAAGKIHGPAIFVAALWIGLTLLLRIRADLGMSDDLPATLDAVQSSCLLNFALWAFMAWLLTDQGRRSFVEWGGRFPPTNYDVELGTKTFLLILFPVFALLLATLPFRSEENQHEFLQLLRDDPTQATMIWLIIAAVVMAPLAEELMFRVILQGWLLPRCPKHLAIIVVALLFSAVHGWPDAVPLFPLSLILGYTYLYFKNYTASVLAHALFNGLNLFLSVSSP